MASNTREYSRDYARAWRARNPEYAREAMRRLRRENPEYLARQRAYNKERSKVDISYRLSLRLRSRLSRAISGRIRHGSAVADLGCSIEMLKSWLMYQFQPGMTWENYGEWEIDHVKPLASFDLTDREQLLEACNWHNLQPLWKADNRSKGKNNG